MSSKRRSMRCASLALVAVVLLMPSRSEASAFGEENLTLGAILSEIMLQTPDVAQTAFYMKEGFGVASDTLRLIKDATGAVKNITLIVKDPKGFAKWAYRSWVAAFPAFREIRNHIVDIQNNVQALNQMSWDKWEHGAFIGVVDDLRRLEGRAYHIALHSEDLFGLAGSKEDIRIALEGDHDRAVKTLDEIAGWISGKALTQRKAAASSAKSNAIASVNAVRSAAALQEMVTHQQTRFLNDYYRYKKADDDYIRALSLPDSLPGVRTNHGSSYSGDQW